MATANISQVQTANTFDEWRIATNNLVDSVNELRNGLYTKDNGNLTVASGYVYISNPIGTTLTVAADSQINGNVVAGNVFSNGSLVLTSASVIDSVTSTDKYNPVSANIANYLYNKIGSGGGGGGGQGVQGYQGVQGPSGGGGGGGGGQGVQGTQGGQGVQGPSGGGGGSPAGSDNQIQYKEGTSLSASPNLTFDPLINSLSVGPHSTFGNNAGSIEIQYNGGVALYGATSGGVGIAAPGVIPSNWTLVLPTNPGTSGQVLKTDGTGVTSWTTVSGGGGSQGTQGLTGPQGTNGASAGLGAPALRMVTTSPTNYTLGGQVFVTTSTPTASAVGDVWFDLNATSGYTQSLANPGWTKLPNGLIIQWGYSQASLSGYQVFNVTLPVAFTSTSSWSVTLSTNRATSGSGGFNHSTILTNQTFTAVFDIQTNGYCGGHWIAIGF